MTCPLNHNNYIPTDLPDSGLSKSRRVSSIPSADGSWVYPSASQFYSALQRKGWETPSESVQTMVDIHDEMNERVWKEVLEWEKLRGSDSFYLAKLEGKPDTLSPKARFFSLFGEKPFDRHDWVVNRNGKNVRYIIDYYCGGTQDDSAVFYADVRPALDSFTAAYDRLKMAIKPYL